MVETGTGAGATGLELLAQVWTGMALAEVEVQTGASVTESVR